MEKFYDRVYKFVKLIPLGKVTTYGEIARACGKPKAARVVGYAIWNCLDIENIPCHRVVNRNGELTALGKMFSKSTQKNMLQNEGVEVVQNKVDLSKYGFYFW